MSLYLGRRGWTRYAIRMKIRCNTLGSLSHLDRLRTSLHRFLLLLFHLSIPRTRLIRQATRVLQRYTEPPPSHLPLTRSTRPSRISITLAGIRIIARLPSLALQQAHRFGRTIRAGQAQVLLRRHGLCASVRVWERVRTKARVCVR